MGNWLAGVAYAERSRASDRDLESLGLWITKLTEKD
jgi:hypothetical protein